MRTDEKIIAKVERTFFPSSVERVKVTLQAYQLGGNSHPHFSATVQGDRKTKSGRWVDDCGGCMHDLILRLWPAAKPIIDLHLANADDGEPMHAEANGFYWLAGWAGGLGEQYHGGSGESAKSPDECLQILADHLRMPLDVLFVKMIDIVEQGKANAAEAGYVVSGVYVPGRREPVNNVIWEEKAIGKAVRRLFHEFIEAQRPRWQAECDAGLALLESLKLEPQLEPVA
jgi:hypothetical protein